MYHVQCAPKSQNSTALPGKTVLYIFGFIQRKELPQRIIAFFCEPPDKSPLYSLSMHIEKKHKNINHPFFGRSFHVGDLLLAHMK